MSLPTIDEIANLDSAADRADWLRRCPDGVIAGYCASIDSALVASDFLEGRAYLKARFALAWAVRCKDGSYPTTMILACHVAEGEMNAALKNQIVRGDG